MGWKNLKDAFSIEHIVHLSDDGKSYLIGSPYIPELAAIEIDTGRIIKAAGWERFLDEHYPALAVAPSDQILALIQKPDTFTESITVYTEKDGQIVEKLCERVGFPNVTHDGLLMYNNTYSTDRNVIVRRAKRSLQIAIKNQMRDVETIEGQLARVHAQIAKDESDLAALDREYPDVAPEGSA